MVERDKREEKREVRGGRRDRADPLQTKRSLAITQIVRRLSAPCPPITYYDRGQGMGRKVYMELYSVSHFVPSTT